MKPLTKCGYLKSTKYCAIESYFSFFTLLLWDQSTIESIQAIYRFLLALAEMNKNLYAYSKSTQQN